MNYKYRVLRNGKVTALSTTLREAQAEAKRIGGSVEPVVRAVLQNPAAKPKPKKKLGPEPKILFTTGDVVKDANHDAVADAIGKILEKGDVALDPDAKLPPGQSISDVVIQWLENMERVVRKRDRIVADWVIYEGDILQALEFWHLLVIMPKAVLTKGTHPDTSAFWAWFKHSQVVDDQGKPLRVYHGSKRAGFTRFDKGEIDAHHNGFFFTDSQEMAASYAEGETEDITPALGQESARKSSAKPFYKSYEDFIKEVRAIASPTVFPDQTTLAFMEDKLEKLFGPPDSSGIGPDSSGIGVLTRYIKGGVSLNPKLNVADFGGGYFALGANAATDMYKEVVAASLKRDAPPHLLRWREALLADKTSIPPPYVQNRAMRVLFQILYYWGMVSKTPPPAVPVPMLLEDVEQLWAALTEKQRLDMFGTILYWEWLQADKEEQLETAANSMRYYADLFGIADPVEENAEKLAKKLKWGYMLRIAPSPGVPISYNRARKVYEDITGEKPDTELAGSYIHLTVPLDNAEQVSDEYKQAVLDTVNGWVKFQNEQTRQEDGAYGTMAVYLSFQNPLVVDGKGAGWRSIPFMGRYAKTDDIAYYAENNGYDSVIIKNIKDYGGSSADYAPHNVYIAFEPTQIKHATLNDGNFSTTKADIRNPEPVTPQQKSLLQRMLGDKASTFAKKVKWVEQHMPNIDDPQSFVGWVVKAEKKR